MTQELFEIFLEMLSEKFEEYKVANGQLTEGANSKTDTPLYKACDIERILEKYRG